MAKTVADVMKMVKGKRSQVRRLPFHRHPRQEQHVVRAGFPLRRRQVHVGSRLRRLLDRRLEGHRGVGHAADAGSEHRQHRPVLRRADPDPDLRRHRSTDGKAYERDPRSLVKRAEACRATIASGLGDTAYFGPEPEVLRVRQRALERRHVGLLRQIRSPKPPGTPARTTARQQLRLPPGPSRAATSGAAGRQARTCVPADVPDAFRIAGHPGGSAPPRGGQRRPDGDGRKFSTLVQRADWSSCRST